VKKKKEGRDIVQLGKGISLSVNTQLLVYAKQQLGINVVKCTDRKCGLCDKL